MPRRLTNTRSALPLFPFLAVSMCMAGALATLVYGYDRLGQQRTIEAARFNANQSQVDDAVAERETLDWRITQLQQSRDKTQEQLAEKQAELSHVEDHLRRLRQQAEQLRLAAEEFQQKGGMRSQQSENTKAELERLRRAIAAAERELQQKDRAQRDRPVTYSVVPYVGPNQTKRRPIYIECRNDAVVIQPEGIALSDRDFEPPLGPGNPLAASIRAYSEHLALAGFTGETTRPYPMLLVRPDGIVAYYAARAALESWGTEFGYELVGADWKLDFPEPDGRLATKLEQVVADARLRQEALAKAAPRQFKRARGPLRASANGRGFVAEGDNEGGRRYGGTGFADRQGQREGFGSGGHSTSPGSRSSGDSFLGGDAASGGGPSGAGDGHSPGELSGSAAGDGDGGFGPRSSPGGEGLTARSASQPGDGFAQGGAAAGRSGPMAGQGAAPAGTAGPTGAQGGATGGEGGAGRGEAGSDKGQPSFGSQDGPQLGGPGGEPGGKSGASRNSTAGQRGGSAENKLGALGSSGQGFQANSRPSAGGGTDGASSGGQPGSASSSSAVSGGASGASGASGGTPPSDDPQSSPSISAQIPAKRSKSIASKRGRDWGLPDAAAHMTPVTRPVIIRCEANQLTIVPDDNRSLPKTIRFGARTEDSVDKLVSGVWDHMKGWGLAGRGMYWRPTLAMEVAPGAESRFRELQTLLEGSGLEVKQRQQRTRAN